MKVISNVKIELRDIQAIALSWFLALGLLSQNFDMAINVPIILISIISCLTTQILADLLIKKQEKLDLISRSAIITSLGLCLLLRTHSALIMALAAACGILSKFLIRYRGKHLFNPANFGIIIVLCCTNQAWVSPGQWGESFSLALLFVGVGGLILSWLGRWETTVVFLLVYSLGIAFRNVWLGFEFEILWHELNSGSLLLFAFFMLSDPRSIPDGKVGRIIWSATIALFTLILKYQFFLATAPFFALFFCSILTPLFDYVWQGKRFNWRETTYYLGGKNHAETQIS